MDRNNHYRIGRKSDYTPNRLVDDKRGVCGKLREKEEEMIRILMRKWGPLLTFVFDRGYASGPWLEVMQKFRAKFIIRWIKKHLFYDQEGREKKLWAIGQGKKYLAH